MFEELCWEFFVFQRFLSLFDIQEVIDEVMNFELFKFEELGILEDRNIIDFIRK